ncbi:hypothetical protein [Petrimonas sp.]|uniref:hypothetical protein n=1 Tax=Petrimonas sp. TaxID=2023866 RepID=UPI002FC997D1
MYEFGFIKLYRQLLDSEIFASPIGLKIWIWCLLKANYKSKFIPLKVGKGETIIEVKRGSFVFGRHKASQELDINGSMIYRWIKKFEEIGMIEIDVNNQYSIITISKYDEYQQQIDDDDQPMNNQRTANEQPMNTTKKDKKDKKDKNSNKGVGVFKTPATLHTVCKNLFIEKFRQLFGEEYYWEAKDGANLNPIIKKIKFNREKKEMPIDDESISVAFSLFLDSITDKWLLENFSIPNINSKFNEIISQAKNGRTKQQNTRPSPSELEAAVEIGMALAAGNR